MLSANILSGLWNIRWLKLKMVLTAFYTGNKDGHQSIPDSKIFSNQNINVSRYEYSEKPILCAGCGLRTALYVKQTMKFKFSDIQAATSDFAKANLLGEGGFGHVYRGCLKDGQVIAAKMRKEESSQGYTEFRSEIQVLSFARHKNIVMLLGYCIKENHTIVVYEYICNKSLDWHLHGKLLLGLKWAQVAYLCSSSSPSLRTYPFYLGSVLTLL